MNDPIDALLTLAGIDRRRQELRKARLARQGKVVDVEKAATTAETAAAAAKAEVERSAALVRQYQADSARCDATIADLRQKQMQAKTNKDYMAVINGIEQAKSEKSMREQSVKDITAKQAALEERAAKAAEAAIAARKACSEAGSAAAAGPDAEEQAIQAEYDAQKAKIDPAFLEVYERLVKANHKMPLLKVDPRTRATPFGGIISHNQIEQIRMGKLVIERTSNSILYIDPAVK